MPNIEHIRSERFDLMFKADRTFQEWNEMYPWQRDDIIERFNKYQKELEAKAEMERRKHE